MELDLTTYTAGQSAQLVPLLEETNYSIFWISMIIFMVVFIIVLLNQYS